MEITTIKKDGYHKIKMFDAKAIIIVNDHGAEIIDGDEIIALHIIDGKESGNLNDKIKKSIIDAIDLHNVIIKQPKMKK